ncbi:MAG: ATP-binding cassette domain-containing protein [Bdellovibrionales bacterium]|nr:ATP-binding cassette domain-containing protein [Bdellovibrionales bacterium]
MSSELYLAARNLNLTFPSYTYKNRSIKDLFVSSLSPLAFKTNKLDRAILKNININFYKGERVGILGLNGSGKTTLCRCLSQKIKTTEGSVYFKHKPMALIQTEAGFLGELSAYENLDLFSKFLYSDLSEKDRQELIQEALAFCGIGSQIHNPIEQYSLGMKSRLALAFITTFSHEILILDEVYNHTDLFFREKMKTRMEKQIRDSNLVIIVSHYEDDFIEYCSRGIVLDQGKVAYDGPISSAIKAYHFFNKVDS